jgi:erythronate-4-phosphate dehydrogenase
MKLLADNTLTNLSNAFPEPFVITHYNVCELPLLLKQPYDILLCRSTLTVNENLLKQSHIQIVATASSGIDHIDERYLNQQMIRLIDAKGSNATAVADYVLATLAYVHRTKGLPGRRVGIVGLGTIGTLVATRLKAYHFSLIYYDPLKAQNNNQFRSASFAELLTCDIICIHANLHQTPPYSSKNLLDDNALAKLKPHTLIINAARGGIVSETALLKLTTPITYCTDVFEQEPSVNPNLIDFCYLCTPHIAGHSIEAKHAAVAMVSQKIHDYYQLARPNYSNLNTPLPLLGSAEHWQDYVLMHYNPMIETNALKKADNQKNAFLELRRAHQTRHNFRLS